MNWNPNAKPSDIIPFLIFFALLGVYFMFLVNRDKVRKESKDWFEEKLKSLELEKDSSSFMLNNSTNNLTARNFLIYTSSDVIYVVNKIYQSIVAINKADILSVELDVYSTEKNVRRLVALTSTYDKRVNLTGIELRITTTKVTHIIQCMVDGKDSNTIPVFDKRGLLDEVNRCKLIIERDIENLNKSKI